MKRSFRFLGIALVACAALGAFAWQSAPTVEQLQRRLDSAEKQLDDWPQLSRYADANAQLPPPAPGEKRVVFFGDSITDSWQLEKYFPGKPYVNRGISGQTTPQMLIRMKPDVIDLKPVAVILLAGTNDIAGNTGPMTARQIEDNYQSIAELARAHHIQMIFASVMPVHNYTPRAQRFFAQRDPAKILELNRWLREYSRANKLVYLNYFSAMVDAHGLLKREISDDGLHPNDAGYKIMAPLAEKAIHQALGK